MRGEDDPVAVVRTHTSVMRMSWAPGWPARSNASWTTPVRTAGVAGHDDVVLDQVLSAPHELALGVAGDVGVTVADVAARRGEAEARMVQLAQGVGVAGDERGRAAAGGFEDRGAHGAADPTEFTAWRFL